MISSGWIAYLIMMNSDLKDKIYSPVFPIVIVVVIAYILASIFLSVFSFSATAILHCFLVDEEVNGNRQPKSLQPFIDRNEEYNAQKNRKAGGAPSNTDKKPESANGVEKPANNVA